MSSNALISFCSRLPHATRDVKWGHDLVFSIGGKMFAAFDLEDTRRFSFKTTPDEFAVLTSLKGISPAPYAARFHWVAVDPSRPLGTTDFKSRLRKSYDLVASKLPLRTRKLLGFEPGPSGSPAVPPPAGRRGQKRRSGTRRAAK